MPEVVPALLRRMEVTDGADGVPEFLDSAGTDASEMCLELGKGHLDRVEVGAVGRQEKEPGAFCLEDGFGLFAFVAGQVVEDDDVARPQGGSKLGLDIGRISPASAALKASQFAVLSGVFWRTPSYERTYDGIGIEG